MLRKKTAKFTKNHRKAKIRLKKTLSRECDLQRMLRKKLKKSTYTDRCKVQYGVV